MAHMDVEDELIALLHSTIRGFLKIPYDNNAVGGHNLWGIIAPADDYLEL